MEPKKTYSEQLKDPRWQKKRLEILSRDNFECVNCGDSKSTLHVHHRKYSYGKMPWDYEDSNFITLCDTCHTIEHSLIEINAIESEREYNYNEDYELNKKAVWDDLFENDLDVPVDPEMIKKLLISLGDMEEKNGNFLIMCMLYDFCDVLKIENINTVSFKVIGEDYKKLLDSYRNVLLHYLKNNALNSCINIKAYYPNGTYRMYL